MNPIHRLLGTKLCRTTSDYFSGYATEFGNPYFKVSVMPWRPLELLTTPGSCIQLCYHLAIHPSVHLESDKPSKPMARALRAPVRAHRILANVWEDLSKTSNKRNRPRRLGFHANQARCVLRYVVAFFGLRNTQLIDPFRTIDSSQQTNIAFQSGFGELTGFGIPLESNRGLC